MHEVVDDFSELADRAALADEVARGRVEWHHAVADAPAPLTFRIQPDDSPHALANEPQRPRLRIVVVVARIAQHEVLRSSESSSLFVNWLKANPKSDRQW